MTARKYEKPLHIEMDFEEALERFGTTDPAELPENIKLGRKRKAGREGRPPRASPSRKREPSEGQS
jgi:hypothetical protein